LLQQEIDFNIAKQKLLTTMGLNPADNANFVDNSIPNEITEDNINRFKNSIGDLQNSINTALKNRIDYSTHLTNKEIAKSNFDASFGGYYPTLSANFNYGYAG
jgi:outer membrane protein TolC